MTGDDDFAGLGRRALVAVLIGVALVAFCFFFIDRPVAWFVHDNRVANPFLKSLTLPPPIVQSWTPAVFAALMIRRAFGPFRRWHLALLTGCVTMVLADQCRQTLGYVFGRYWPDTWIDDNPSLIRDGAYGFNFFHGGEGYASFPSGHTARTVGFAAVYWIAYPKWRWACGLATLLVAIGLIGMNYHFVGDVVAGGFIGGIVGGYAAYFAGLQMRPTS